MKDDVLRYLFLGFIRLHILYHAAKESICGVELMEELEHHGYDVGPGTLYPDAAPNAEGRLDSLAPMKWSAANDGRILEPRPPARNFWSKLAQKLQELVSEVVEDKDGRQCGRSNEMAI